MLGLFTRVSQAQTLAYALTHSPVGPLAWIVEKFRVWSDCGGDVQSAFSLAWIHRVGRLS